MLHPTASVGNTHPDDRIALGSLAGPALRQSLERQWREEDFVPVNFEENLVLIGSAGPEGLSRLIFGYRNNGKFLEYVGTPLDLPYHWVEDEREVRSECLRYQSGGAVTTRPNWGVRSLKGAAGATRFPELDRQHFLASDLLLVSRIPNFLSVTRSGSTLISVGGTHGVGTRAVSLVTKDRDVVSQILETLRESGTDYFQALLSAEKIHHHEGSGSVATTVRLLDVVPLHFTDLQLEKAFDSAASAYTGWVSETSTRANQKPFSTSPNRIIRPWFGYGPFEGPE
ncbi:hypothetical protein [Serinicoccus chungangensis]|uniref:hypothetical protein n=1 Tax=Serinicoccus chungangensis TaxID=767452 RepID=UPI00111835AF|nr:hypothetical protein [Serinicoccus chungangensis]